MNMGSSHTFRCSIAWQASEAPPRRDKSGRRNGTFSRSDFIYDPEGDVYYCPGGKTLHQYRRPFKKERDAIDGDGMRRYRASKHDCEACVLKQVCVPKAPARKIMRSVFEGARDMARDIAQADDYVISMRQRKKVEMLFAHLKRIMKLDRLRLREPNGARDEFHIAATAQNLRKMAKLIQLPA